MRTFVKEFAPVHDDTHFAQTVSPFPRCSSFVDDGAVRAKLRNLPDQLPPGVHRSSEMTVEYIISLFRSFHLRGK